MNLLSLTLGLCLLGTASAKCTTDAITEHEQAALDAHNRLRDFYDAEPLCWGVSDESVTFSSQAWIDTFSLLNKGHSAGFNNSEYGENWSYKGYSWSNYNTSQSYETAIGIWAKGAENNGSMFAQMVWKNTKQVNCGYKYSSQSIGSMGTIYGRPVVCQYYPRGAADVDGGYAANVGPLNQTKWDEANKEEEEENNNDDDNNNDVTPTRPSSAVGLFNASVVAVMITISMFMA